MPSFYFLPCLSLSLPAAIPHTLTATLSKHTDEVWFLRFSHSGRELATCAKDGRCIVWDMTTLAPRHVLCGHTAGGWVGEGGWEGERNVIAR